MHTTTTADTAPVVEHLIITEPGREITVVHQGADFAVANINLTRHPDAGVDLTAAQVRSLIGDLEEALTVLEEETPVSYWPAA